MAFAFSRSIMATRTQFWVAQALLGWILEAETPLFSRYVATHAGAISISCEMYKTLAGATLLAHRSFCATKQKRQKLGLRACSTPFNAAIVLRCRFGSLGGRPRTGPGSPLDAHGVHLPRPGHPKSGLGATFGRPVGGQGTSRHVPETALGAQNGPRANFRRFFGDFGGFFIDNCKICQQFSKDFGTTLVLSFLFSSAPFLCCCVA